LIPVLVRLHHALMLTGAAKIQSTSTNPQGRRNVASPHARSIVCANPLRSPSDPHAHVLDEVGLLRRYLVGTRRHTPGVAPERQHRFPLFGLINYLGGRWLSPYRGECLRFAAVPLFERWVRKRLQPGDHLLAGVGYLNGCMEYVRLHGGLSLIEARNSHPSSFWSLVAEEYARWGCALPPIYPAHHFRQQRTVALADYVFSPSRFVTESFAARGFPTDRILELPYPVDLSLFKPAAQPRPKDRPLTLINTGGLTLRKGSPYLFEAFEQIRREVPDARLLLTRALADNFEPLFSNKGWGRLSIEWAGSMPHPQLVRRLQEADIFIMPSIEEGMVRSVAEAMACGLYAVVTHNTGMSDLIREGVNGSVVPIRDSGSIARAVLERWGKIRKGEEGLTTDPAALHMLSPEVFQRKLLAHCQALGLYTPALNGAA